MLCWIKENSLSIFPTNEWFDISSLNGESLLDLTLFRNLLRLWNLSTSVLLREVVDGNSSTSISSLFLSSLSTFRFKLRLDAIKWKMICIWLLNLCDIDFSNYIRSNYEHDNYDLNLKSLWPLLTWQIFCLATSIIIFLRLRYIHKHIQLRLSRVCPHHVLWCSLLCLPYLCIGQIITFLCVGLEQRVIYFVGIFSFRMCFRC